MTGFTRISSIHDPIDLDFSRMHSEETSLRVARKEFFLSRVASVSVGFSVARSRRFSLFGGAKIGASATLMEAAGRAAYFFALAPIFARSRSEKCFKPAESGGKPYGNACYAG